LANAYAMHFAHSLYSGKARGLYKNKIKLKKILIKKIKIKSLTSLTMALIKAV
jgi:hypothetical protein